MTVLAKLTGLTALDELVEQAGLAKNVANFLPKVIIYSRVYHSDFLMGGE